jgi:hypothetical protein
VDKKTICNYGRVRYLDAGSPGQLRVTNDFYTAVKSLPDTYDGNKYSMFIEDWGTVSIVVYDYVYMCICVHSSYKQKSCAKHNIILLAFSISST